MQIGCFAIDGGNSCERGEKKGAKFAIPILSMRNEPVFIIILPKCLANQVLNLKADWGFS
jgi:hypothetical protein